MSLFWSFLHGTGPEHVDVEDVHRSRDIREATYQQESDAESRVLRTSGKPTPMGRSLLAITTRERTR